MSDLLENLIQKIKVEFPDIQYSNAKLITHGWDNEVVILDNTFIFRFPRNNEYQDRFKVEVRLLEYLKDKVNVAIPEYAYISQDKTWGGHYMIQGEELQAELFQTQSDNVKEKIVKDLANFLTVIHKTPKEVVQEMGISTGDDYSWSPSHVREIYEGVKSKLYPILRTEEISWIDYQFNHYFSLRSEINQALVHSDLNGDHIFFDEKQGKISGIIDFANVYYADSAVDFSRLLDYGEDFMRKVIDQYQGFKDEDLVQRAKFRRLIGAVGNMLRIIHGEQMPTTFEDQRHRLNKRMKSFPVNAQEK